MYICPGCGQSVIIKDGRYHCPFCKIDVQPLTEKMEPVTGNPPKDV
jgi:uncharacterized Zn finger protein (UPF0148 family)